MRDSEWRNEGTLGVARALATYWFRGPETVAAGFDRPDAPFAEWDALSQGPRRLIGLAGHHAPARIGPRGNWEPGDATCPEDVRLRDRLSRLRRPRPPVRACDRGCGPRCGRPPGRHQGGTCLHRHRCPGVTRRISVRGPVGRSFMRMSGTTCRWATPQSSKPRSPGRPACRSSCGVTAALLPRRTMGTGDSNTRHPR